MYAYSALASASHRICIIAQKKQDFFFTLFFDIESLSSLA